MHVVMELDRVDVNDLRAGMGPDKLGFKPHQALGIRLRPSSSLSILGIRAKNSLSIKISFR